MRTKTESFVYRSAFEIHQMIEIKYRLHAKGGASHTAPADFTVLKTPGVISKTRFYMSGLTQGFWYPHNQLPNGRHAFSPQIT